MSSVVRKLTFLPIIFLSVVLFCKGQDQDLSIPLWEGKIPLVTEGLKETVQDLNGIKWIEQVHQPNLAVYLPNERIATGQAVVICPGGGYKGLAYDWEGMDIAKWLNAKGIAGIVLKYQLPVHYK